MGQHEPNGTPLPHPLPDSSVRAAGGVVNKGRDQTLTRHQSFGPSVFRGSQTKNTAWQCISSPSELLRIVLCFAGFPMSDRRDDGAGWLIVARADNRTLQASRHGAVEMC